MTASRPLLAIDAAFVRDLHRRYATDPASVDVSWASYFDGLDAAPGTNGHATPDGLAARRAAVMLGRLIENYRWRGHRSALTDPLGRAAPAADPDLTLDRLGLGLADPSVTVPLDGELGLVQASLDRALARLQEIYCGSIGFEFMHVESAGAREWLRDAIETGWGTPDRALRRMAAERLIEADELEQFMTRRFVGKKRFGLEGGESLISAMAVMLAHSARLGARVAVLGGTSRGRLNQMINICGKPIAALFAETAGAHPFPEGVKASGDVAYHLGHASDVQLGEQRLLVDYCYNPSHLEAVDTVALGRVRALQARIPDRAQARREILGLLVHTDAAFAGQGVVAEGFQLSRLRHYETGGTLHVIINNQLGFTTEPTDGRSSTYCSDVAKTVGAPVFHVNGDDLDAVARAAMLAAEYRHRFQGDVVIDLVCYRRRGHNEVDEPTFTQPAMYRAIADQPTTRQVWLPRLHAEGVLTPEEETAVAADMRARLEAGYDAAKHYRANQAGGHGGSPASGGAAGATGVAIDRLRALGRAISTPPAGLSVNPKVTRALTERLEALDSGSGIGWALAEALALASLAAEDKAVRLSGQDTPRGAFTQRHFILHDQQDGRAVPIFDLLPTPHGLCEIIASPIAEYATLGFEYGYSLDAPDCLVVWEAQFGDFANVAQTIIDQFVTSGEDKWLQRSHLTLLLPHGLEGQGAEHSSARVERFLQMGAGDNVRIVNCSTPANYFHALRGQIHGPRRPLIVFTPKSLLRHRLVVSSLAELGDGTGFRPVIGPDAGGPLRRIVLCSGKIYWELLTERQNRALSDVGLIRLEQLHPFPQDALADALRPHAGAEIVWCQEEPRNMGPWSHVDRRIEWVLRDIGSTATWPAYVGRPENPSPAMGTTADHEADQARLIVAALGLPAA